ncbi:unnamed protein product [marine sediment metagenome]|uniref:Uncharacterized protein n=1 Tax=marine sediment metagenome TaxID=412755 RepID=X1EVU7_9ZZZZ
MLPESLRKNETLLAGCVAGAELTEKYLELISNSGFENIEIVQKVQSSTEELNLNEETGDPLLVVDGEIMNIEDLDEIKEDVGCIQESIQSITVTAIKPKKDY